MASDSTVFNPNDLPPHAQYKYFLGDLISMFTDVEIHLGWALLHCSGVPKETLATLVGFPSALRLGEIIKKLLPLRGYGEDAIKSFEQAFDRLRILIPVRDRLVHAGGNHVDSREFLIRLTPKNIKENGPIYELFRKEELINITLDLHTIKCRLLYYLIPISDMHREYYRFHKDVAWRYSAPDRGK